MSIKEGNNMTQKLIRIYKGKLSEVAAQIKAEAQEYKEKQFKKILKRKTGFTKMSDNIISPKQVLDLMVKRGNISKERAEELKKTVK